MTSDTTFTKDLFDYILNNESRLAKYAELRNGRIQIKIGPSSFESWVDTSDGHPTLYLGAYEKLAAKHLRTVYSSSSVVRRTSANTYSLREERYRKKPTTEHWVAPLNEFLHFTLDQYSILNPAGDLDGLLPMFWWDNKSNFGDDIGSWISARMTGLRPVNMRQSGLIPTTIMSVGSIIAQIENSKTVIWGSGLIAPLSDDQIKRLKELGQVQVYAVRGKETAAQLTQQLDWHVPAIYGDPALLLPRYLKVSQLDPDRRQIAIIPHYAHKIDPPAEATDFKVVDVAQDVNSVVNHIATSKAVISTSLHGLIIAQAYGIPWVWLQLADAPLKGNDFKFRDFFSTLSGPEPAIYRTTSRELIDYQQVATLARLPNLAIDLDELNNSFPFKGNVIGAHSSMDIDKTKKHLLGLKLKIKEVAKRGILNRIDSVLRNQKEIIALLSQIDRNGREANKNAREVAHHVSQIRADLKTTRLNTETVKRHVQAPVYRDIRANLEDRQLGILETLHVLATTERSFARYGDGEFRLMVHPDEDIQFQRNSAALRADLMSTLQSASDNLLIGFPQIYNDSNWSAIWADLWEEVRHLMPTNSIWGNAHVTRPLVFKKYRQEAVQAWRQVWENKRICVITGASSRFELIPELFDNVKSICRIDSRNNDAYDDIQRILSETEKNDADIFLIALGPAGTILARRLVEHGRRALDIGHLSDSYQNVFDNLARPESKPVSKK